MKRPAKRARDKRVDRQTQKPKAEGPILGLVASPVDRPSLVHYLIVVAIEEEFSAICTEFGPVHPLRKVPSDVHTIHSATATAHDGTPRHVLIQQLDVMGPIQAAAQTASAVTRYLPLNVLLVGICAGIKGKADLGDVVLGDTIFDVSLGRISRTKGQITREVRWKPFQSSPALRDVALKQAKAAWQIRRPQSPPGLHGKAGPKLLSGDVVSGTNVIADAGVAAQSAKPFRNAIAIEMEGGGVATAVRASSNDAGWLLIKGVSDRANKSKNRAAVRKWRQYAATSAAVLAAELIKTHPLHQLHRGPPPKRSRPGPVKLHKGPREEVRATRLSASRTADVEQLKVLMAAMPVEIVEHYLERALLGIIPHRVLSYLPGFSECVNRSTFMVRDEGLNAHVQAFVSSFLPSLEQFGDYFDELPNGRESRLRKGRADTRGETEIIRTQWNSLIVAASISFRSLLTHLQRDWPEVDLHACSQLGRAKMAQEKARSMWAEAREAVESAQVGSDERVLTIDLLDDDEVAAARILERKGQATVSADRRTAMIIIRHSRDVLLGSDD